MSDLAHLTELAEKHFAAETRVALLEADLEVAKRAMRDLAEKDIPKAMEDVGMEKFLTTSGLEIIITSPVYGKDLRQTDAAALAWLRKNGQAGLIRTVVDVPFSAGSEADADDLVDRLAGEGIAAQKDVRVLANSLKAAVARMRKDGADVPMELLRLHEKDVAKVTPKR